MESIMLRFAFALGSLERRCPCPARDGSREDRLLNALGCPEHATRSIRELGGDVQLLSVPPIARAANRNRNRSREIAIVVVRFPNRAIAITNQSRDFGTK